MTPPRSFSHRLKHIFMTAARNYVHYNPDSHLAGYHSGKDLSLAIEPAPADSCRNKLGQPDKALLHLKKALMLQDDVDVENRICTQEKK